MFSKIMAHFASKEAAPVPPEKYVNIISYFSKRRFGSEPPIMSMLSRLPLSDRIIILDFLIYHDPMNLHLCDKLSMAFSKVGELAKANQVLDEGRRRGVINDFNYPLMKESLVEFAARTGQLGSSINYQEALSQLQSDWVSEEDPAKKRSNAEFYEILVSFCREQL